MPFLSCGEKRHMHPMGTVAGAHPPWIPWHKKAFSLSLLFGWLNPGESFRKKRVGGNEIE